MVLIPTQERPLGTTKVTEMTMGRPTLGKRAMTSAERQRRYWERIIGTEAQAQIERLQAKLKAVRQRSKELKVALAARD